LDESKTNQIKTLNQTQALQPKISIHSRVTFQPI